MAGGSRGPNRGGPELVIHLAELDTRPSPYAALGHGSLFAAPSEGHATFAPHPSPARRRPIIETTSPERYRVQFTIGKESHERLRRLQTLLRREIPDGDPGVIVDRALVLLLAQVEKAKRGAADEPRPIRPGTDKAGASRHIPRHVQREATRRDGDQCAFVSKDGHRCTERAFLEFHHVRAYAQGGFPTVDNISVRCRRHNQYEGELVFGPREILAPRANRSC